MHGGSFSLAGCFLGLQKESCVYVVSGSSLHPGAALILSELHRASTFVYKTNTDESCNLYRAQCGPCTFALWSK